MSLLLSMIHAPLSSQDADHRPEICCAGIQVCVSEEMIVSVQRKFIISRRSAPSWSSCLFLQHKQPLHKNPPQMATMHWEPQENRWFQIKASEMIQFISTLNVLPRLLSKAAFSCRHMQSKARPDSKWSLLMDGILNSLWR